MRKQLEQLHNLLAGIQPERRTIKSQLSALEAQLKKYDKVPDDFAYEIKTTKAKISELRTAQNARSMSIHKTLLEAAQELETLLSDEVKRPVDLTDTKFANAMQLASLATLDHNQATSLAEQFRGNTPALRLLKSKFQEREISSGIDELIVDPMGIKTAIENNAFHVSSQGGSPVELAKLIGKTAKQFGVDLPELETDPGIAWEAAGLPVPVPGAK